MKIVKSSKPGGSCTGGLRVTKKRIVKVLGFEANIADDPVKVGRSWSFRADGEHCAIWFYKGSRIASTFGPAFVFERLFGWKAVI